MSICKSALNDTAMRKRIVEMYTGEKKMLAVEIGKELDLTVQTVRAALQMELSTAAYNAEKALRYSRGKIGALNPMQGKTGEQHHNWKGECSDDKGYTTLLVDGTRYFMHRVVMARAIGIHPKDLPQKMIVHHIDGNSLNNDLENLALVTASAHRSLHLKWQELPVKPTLWDSYKSSIS